MRLFLSGKYGYLYVLGFGIHAWITIVTVLTMFTIAERLATSILDVCGTNPIVVMAATASAISFVSVC